MEIFNVFSNRKRFTLYTIVKDQVQLGNEQVCEILQVGDVQLKFQNGTTFMLKNVDVYQQLTTQAFGMMQAMSLCLGTRCEGPQRDK